MILIGIISFLFSLILITLVFTERFFSLLKHLWFFASGLLFLIILFLLFYLDKSSLGFQLFWVWDWNPSLNIKYILALDGLSSIFIFLTSLLIPLIILYSWNHFPYCFKEFLILLGLIELFLLNFFLVIDFFFFFFFFETILIPMFLLIGCFGSRQRRIHASFQFFLFTMIGSFFMLTAIFIIYINQGSTDFLIFYQSKFSHNLELLLWFFFFFSLSIKIPLFPLHIWLPEAHVEAPTIGSVILAGVLLKMGSYGMLRFLIPTFHFANQYFLPMVFILSFLSIYYISLITFCQIDLKKLIAYSSVAHMGYVTISLFYYDLQALQGSIFLMFSHGIVSSLLFFLIGILYDRFKTRVIFFFQSLKSFMPIYSFIFFIATLANIGFPGTIGFIGEFLMLLSFFNSNKIIFIFNTLGFLISASYSFWLYNRICMNGIIRDFKFGDISKREFFSITPLLFLIIFLGICPKFIFSLVDFYTITLIINSKGF